MQSRKNAYYIPHFAISIKMDSPFDSFIREALPLS